MNGSYPKQLVSEAEKNDEWCEKNLDSIAKNLETSNESLINEKNKDINNYMLYNGHVNMKDYEYITDQYGVPYPATLNNFPITKNKIDLLVNEDLKRPIDKKVSAVNKDAALRKEKFKISLIANNLLQEINADIEGELGMELEMDNKEFPIPDDIDEFMRYEYKEVIEEVVNDGLEYLTRKYRFKDLFKDGFRDMLVTGKEIYKAYIKDGDPYVRRVDPRSFVYDKSIESDYIENAQWAAEERWLTVNEVLDEFRDSLSKDDVREIEEMRQLVSADDLSRYNNTIEWVDYDADKGVRIRIISAEWKSIKAIKFKISENKYNPEFPFKKVVKDDYKPRKNENIETRYVDDIWEATKIGGKIMVNARRRPNQVRSVDDAGTTPLSYIGVIHNHNTGKYHSMVDLMRHVQMLYNIVMYHIELTMARAGGKAVIYDVAQMPTNIGMDMQTVMYHLKNDGIIPINSQSEGMEGNTFNQFQSVDFTLSNSVQQLINLKMMLEQTAGQITGVSPQREGAVEQYEYVGNVQRSVVQSSLATEGWFHQHNELKKLVFERLANLMKLAWAGGKKAGYILGDGGYAFLNVLPDVALNDYGVFVGDGGKDDAMKQMLQQMSQAALQSGTINMLDVIKVLKADTMTEAEHILERGIEAMQKQQQSMQEQQMQMQQAESEAKQADKEFEMQKAQLDVEGKVKVAEINAQARIEAQEIASQADRDIDDVREKGKLQSKAIDADIQSQMAEKKSESDRKMMAEKAKHDKEIASKKVKEKK
tara:strand:- start:1737 stop:4028 length:2292 start_codon:yes stop_codon:yes gene_type:complete